MRIKPLGRKAYGSIGHLPNSRLGPSDSCVTEGQAKIATEKKRDKHDDIIVQEKLDGSCVSAAKIDGNIVALGRAGYHARSSKYEMHHLWADWVDKHKARFDKLLGEGERVVGEWLAQAHGTIYKLDVWDHEPFFAFDIMVEEKRCPFDEFSARAMMSGFQMPTLLSHGEPMAVTKALDRHRSRHVPCNDIEGVVYRVERKGKVDFLAKYVVHKKVDGMYLDDDIWNWRP